MRFLYHGMVFLICENKRTKENRKTSHIIECVMILLFSMLRKLRYVKCQAFDRNGVFISRNGLSDMRKQKDKRKQKNKSCY